ncbi:MAG: penicillin acylase family protein, partial [Candidatus Neomarinimicrobiota bacterium]
INDIINNLSETTNRTKAEIAHRIATIYMENHPSEMTPVRILSDWNGEESEPSAELLLINVIYPKLINNIFVDEFSLAGDDVFDIFTGLPLVAEHSVRMILNDPESGWIDDIKTVNYQEDLTDIVIKSVNEVINELEIELGGNSITGAGTIANTKIYKHILYERPIFAKIFKLNIGSNENAGLISNLTVGGHSAIKTYNQSSGISLRRIFDLSDLSTSYSILPTGQSGLPKSVHYADQAELFNTNKFRKIEFDEATIRNNDQYQKLVLCPVK